MRTISAAQDSIWRSGQFLGPNRSVARVTIQHAVKRKTSTAKGRFTTLQFNQARAPQELLNVRSVTWDRSVDLEVASGTVTMWNCQPIPIGAQPAEGWEQFPGYYSPRAARQHRPFDLQHGQAGLVVDSDTRAQSPVGIRADMVLRTYEGYGLDPTVTPDQDSNLQLTGVWLIDKVVFGADGIITISMRDMGRQLVDEIAFPPVVPLAQYPLSFSSYQTIKATQARVEQAFTFHLDSANNVPQMGHTGADALDGDETTFWFSKAYSKASDVTRYQVTCPKVDLNGLIFRPWHGQYKVYVCVEVNYKLQGTKTFDGFKFITAITCKGGDAPVDIQFGGTFHNVTSVLLLITNLDEWGASTQSPGVTTGGAVLQAISKAAGEQGVPYSWAVAIAIHESGLDPRSVGDSGTSFGLYQLHQGGELGTLTPEQAKDPYTNASVALAQVGAVKRANPSLSAGDVAVLAQRPLDSLRPAYIAAINAYVAANHPELQSTAAVSTPADYRAGIRSLHGYAVVKTATHKVGNYSDFTDIIKLFAAMGGFYWPPASFVYSGGVQSNYSPTTTDPVLGAGRVWGDLESTGTSGVVEILSSEFDKKPLLDGITYIRNILGYHFAIDETGGIVWRLPNWWRIGCWGPNGYLPGVVHLLDEKTVLRDLQVSEDSADQRSIFFVANPNGHIGAAVPGFDDNPAGLDRVAIYEDVHFADATQTRISADLLALRSFFNYHQDSVQVSGNPAIQVDDQCRITEYVTREANIHHIRGIKSNNDMEKGSYVMDLTTSWLGDNPTSRWAFDPARLLPETRAWLATRGIVL